MSPRVTIVVPIYNAERTLAKCLDSIMSQSLTDIEILCIDDCSADASVEIVKSLQARDSRIKLVQHQSNLGPGGARNTGIQLATAQYIASVDSDDYISSTMIDSLYQPAVEGRYDIIVCGLSAIDEDGNTLETYLPRHELIDLRQTPRNIFTLTNPSFCNKLWNKSLFLDHKIFFPNHSYYSDSATTPRILFKARTIYFIGENHYKYCRRSGSITNTHSAKHVLDYLRVFDIIKEFLIEERVWDKHREDFEAKIVHHLSRHAKNVSDARNVNDETRQYLRHLLLLKEAYIKFDDDVRQLSTEELRACLLSSLRPTLVEP
jgi:glycosyltransferase involved in cell wall biosynthesis